LPIFISTIPATPTVRGLAVHCLAGRHQAVIDVEFVLRVPTTGFRRRKDMTADLAGGFQSADAVSDFAVFSNCLRSIPKRISSC
jgi:hypothetical protein